MEKSNHRFGKPVSPMFAKIGAPTDFSQPFAHTKALSTLQPSALESKDKTARCVIVCKHLKESATPNEESRLNKQGLEESVIGIV